jgi:hypothetical protein
VIAFGLGLAVASTIAINGGYALQHAAASSLPPLSLRRPLASLGALASNRSWVGGFLGGIGGWVLYVAALRLAPLSIVQAASAGGIAILAVGVGRLGGHERIGVGSAAVGLILLALSLGAHPAPGHAGSFAVALWLTASLAAAGTAILTLPRGAGLATAAGVLYAAGDVGTKAAVAGGARLLFAPTVLLAHGLAFVCMQLAFQRGGRLATAGLAVLWTNALPILAGTVLFAEGVPGGWKGGARVAAFALVLIGAVALGRQFDAPEAVATLSID